MARFWKYLKRLIIGTVLVLATLLLGRGFEARRMDDIRPWQHVQLKAELHADDFTKKFTFADYLKREDLLFRELDEKVLGRTAPDDRFASNRYWREGPNNPLNFPKNWNRTTELTPDKIQGGVLLIHGLSDSPYSMKPLAEYFQSKGFYALCMRMPGHGTIPASLTEAHWEDWLAAVKLGARQVHDKLTPGQPFYLVGYSNGGALVLKYSLDALADKDLPAADRMVLLSPMIGVDPFAVLAKFISRLGGFAYFEKSKWLDLMPEYIAYKYNSFPAQAAYESHRITRTIQKQIERDAKSGRLKALPPILTFQSLVDSTVSTAAVAQTLYSYLPESHGSHLVVYDLNRFANVGVFLKSADKELLSQLFMSEHRSYPLSVVTNSSPETQSVVERSADPHSNDIRIVDLGLAWPPQVFSLSHVALPMPPDDPIYGFLPPAPGAPKNAGFWIGGISPRGEKWVLTVPIDQFMRLYANPFFSYERGKIDSWLATK